MKIKVFLICMMMLLLFNTNIFAQSNYDFKNDNITFKYHDVEEKEDREITLESLVARMEGNILISLNTIRQLNDEAEFFVTLPTYSAYNGYLRIAFMYKDANIDMTQDNKNYRVINDNFKIVKQGSFSVSPFEYGDDYYVPLEAFKVSGYPIELTDEGIFIDLTSRQTVSPVIQSYDKKRQVFTIKQNEKQYDYKFIGVKFPEDEKEFNQYSKSYIDSLIGKEVSLWFDKSKSSVKFNTEDDYIYVYAYFINDTVSLNEQIIKHGYSYYEDQDVGTEFKQRLTDAAKYASNKKLGVNFTGNDLKLLSKRQFKVLEVINTSKYVEEHDQGQTVYTERKIVLEQNGKVFIIDFLDDSLSLDLEKYVSLTLNKYKTKYMNKIVTLKSIPNNNYDFVLYLTGYSKNNK